MDNIPIFLASDNNYAPFVATTIVSICKNTKSFCAFYILDGGIDQENQDKICSLVSQFDNFSIEFIQIDFRKALQSILYKNACPHVTLSTYNRFLIPQLKPEIKKLIYLDVDVIVKGDITELYNVDLQGYAIGAVPEDFTDNFGIEDLKIQLGLSGSHLYFNAGVLLIDNEKFNPDLLFEIEQQYRDKLKYADQDILNIAYHNNYLVLPEKFNFMSQKQEHFENITVRHFNTNVKPWQFNPNIINTDIFIYDVPLFWKYAKLTPFYDQLFINVSNVQEQEAKFRKKRLELMMSKIKNKKG